MKRYHVFKVVRRTEQHLMSVTDENHNSIFSLEYFPKKYVKPIIGMLFAFSTLESLYSFSGKIEDNSDFQFWDCLTTKKPIHCNFLIPYWRTTFEAFWDNYPERFNSDYMMSAPWGTVLCEDLKLWKQVS